MLITCPKCNAAMRVPEDSAGKKVQCPKCASIVQVPVESTDISATPDEPGPAGTEVTVTGPAPRNSRAARDDDDIEDFPPRRRDLDDDEFDITRGRAKPINSMAMASMITGVAALSFGSMGCLCCGIIGALISLVGGIMAVSFGFMGRVPGSESYARAGIICGSIAIALGLLGIVAGIAWIGLNVGMMNFG